MTNFCIKLGKLRPPCIVKLSEIDKHIQFCNSLYKPDSWILREHNLTPKDLIFHDCQIIDDCNFFDTEQLGTYCGNITKLYNLIQEFSNLNIKHISFLECFIPEKIFTYIDKLQSLTKITLKVTTIDFDIYEKLPNLIAKKIKFTIVTDDRNIFQKLKNNRKNINDFTIKLRNLENSTIQESPTSEIFKPMIKSFFYINETNNSTEYFKEVWLKCSSQDAYTHRKSIREYYKKLLLNGYLIGNILEFDKLFIEKICRYMIERISQGYKEFSLKNLEIDYMMLEHVYKILQQMKYKNQIQQIIDNCKKLATPTAEERDIYTILGIEAKFFNELSIILGYYEHQLQNIQKYKDDEKKLTNPNLNIQKMLNNLKKLHDPLYNFTGLDLSENNLDDKCQELVEKIIALFPNLESLNLCHNPQITQDFNFSNDLKLRDLNIVYAGCKMKNRSLNDVDWARYI